MKYTVVIVEDEPAATENLCDIIRLYCPLFRVVACGESGIEGLELAHAHRPDLVITDIRMPKMDGLVFLQRLREELPQVEAIIVSGYQDFEYARTALQHGATDYLLKPVGPSNLRAALERVKPKLAENLYKWRIGLIRRLSRGEGVQEWELRKHFPEETYLAAVSRKNGLPRRFSQNAATEIFSGSGEVMMLYGRDEMESLYLCPGQAVSLPQFTGLVTRPDKSAVGYTTTVLWSEVFPIRSLPLVIKELYQALDSRLVIGLAQTITLREEQPKLQMPPYLDAESVQKIEYFARERKYDTLKKLLCRLLAQWEQEKRPQLWTEGAVRYFLDRLQAAAHLPVLDQGLEFMIDDAFCYATCFEDLQESLLDILAKYEPEPGANGKVDTPEYFEMVRQYVDDHLSDMLTLQALCKQFGISQTYLSRLFRKYAGQSFNSYLTLIRMEKAKVLLSESDMLIKDVAAMVGYADQFYFSRLFRSLTGVSPTEYIAAGSKDKHT